MVQAFFYSPPQPGYHQVIGAEELHITGSEGELGHHSLVVVAEHPLAVNETDVAERSGSGQALHPVHIHALFFQRLEDQPAVCVGSYRAEIGGLPAHTADVDRHIDRVPAGKHLAGVVVIIHAVIAYAGNLHTISSFARSSASRAYREGASI